ncbi:MAG: DUF6526 family protein [Chitinophagaceae bacterium]
MSQNYKNHTRFIVLWHIVISVAIIYVLVSSIITCINTSGDSRYSSSLFIILSVAAILIWVYARSFALKAQDRAIRAEEHFRHYILTGKPHDSRLHLRQIIALRFASDAEMPALAKKAVEENLSQKQIKQAVQNWKGDYDRA